MTARRFFVLVAVGTGWLATDELLSIHETIGHNILFLGRLPGVQHSDDVIVALYALPALVLAYAYRRLLLASPAALACFAVAVISFAGAIVCDTLFSIRLEEILEATGALALLAGLAVLAMRSAGWPGALRPRTQP